jgi:hypothetical protein
MLLTLEMNGDDTSTGQRQFTIPYDIAYTNVSGNRQLSSGNPPPVLLRGLDSPPAKTGPPAPAAPLGTENAAKSGRYRSRRPATTR